MNPKVETQPQLIPLPAKFFAPAADKVAEALLGHWLIRRESDGFSGGLIVETEAYFSDDPACHAYRGQTARNAAMFGPAGRAYVYFIYGNHWCFNAVCHQEGVGEAVLVRAIEPMFGLGAMQQRRAVARPRDLTNGPAKLCAALGLNREHDGMDLCDESSPVFVARNPRRTADIRRFGPIVRTTRVGLTKAADWPLRFYLGGSEFVSRRQAGSER
jgi:DNA-3-methyladenine glycosylase